MKTTARIERPERIEVTLTITLPLEDWQKVAEQLGGLQAPWPSSDIVRGIQDVVYQARKTFSPGDPL